MDSGTFRRSWAQAYFLYISAKRNMFRLMDVTVWPLVLFLSMVLFAGLLTEDKKLIGLVVLGALGWRVLYHFELEPVIVYMENYWASMTEHLMMSPLRPLDLLLGGAVSAVAKVGFLTLMFLGLAWLLFGYAVTAWGTMLLGMLALAACGVVLAVFSLGVAYLKRGDAFAFIFAFPDAVAVLSGVFYPVSAFPEPFRTLALSLPTTQAFELLKSANGMGDPNILLFFVTLAAWTVVSVLFIRWALARARRSGRLLKTK